ncbi:hypothetical protein JW948_16990 [bacterium]|nr:hypothetical protein [bacterium]
MKKYLPVLTALLTAAGFMSGEESGLTVIMPDAGVLSGWHLEEPAQTYSPETLYEAIDGEATLYHEYGFVAMMTQSYYLNEDTAVTVNLYDMGSPENAFGIYTRYRFPGYEFEKIGAEAMVAEYGIKFCQGRYFADISSWGTGSVYDRAVYTLAGELSAAIGGSTEIPGIANLLPAAGRTDKSLNYTAVHSLNQAFLKSGIEADYVFGDDSGKGMVLFFESNTEAHEALNRLAEFYHAAAGSVLRFEQDGGVLMIRGKDDKYSEFNVLDTTIIGAAGFGSVENIGQLLESIRETQE